ncbi:RNA polymerase sigma factor [Ruminococcus sp.]|uniref:RNA polymerase sigma factor n=1 Tax=Ruminococcus sp. TaxID=41978 RepID=UPI0025F21249|nr:RNA polymerase sigma factor [Ruminococcus sp.]MBQ8967478.1 RNA polymerase sigma factor [Ruminococcus sp.]
MTNSEQTAAVMAAKGGDRQAFEMLYADYRDKLFFFVLKNVGSREAAEDVVSETFLDAMENIGSLRAEEAFGSWLYSIAYRKCIRCREENSRTAHFESEEEQELAMSDAALNEPLMLPDDYAVNSQRREQLKAVIDGLSREQKAAVILYYYNEQPLREVAKTLGISEGAARKRLFDARKKIKEKVEGLMRYCTFCAVPVDAMLQGSIDQSYAGAAVKAGSAVKAITFVKIAAVGVAAAVAVGVPLALGHFGKNSKPVGDVRPDVSNSSSAEESERSIMRVKLVKYDPENHEMLAIGDDETKRCSLYHIKVPDDCLGEIERSPISGHEYKIKFSEGIEETYPATLDGVWSVKQIFNDQSRTFVEPYYEDILALCKDISPDSENFDELVENEILSYELRVTIFPNLTNGEVMALKYLIENELTSGNIDTQIRTGDELTAEYELVQYNKDSGECLAADSYSLYNFTVPDEFKAQFDSYERVPSGLSVTVTFELPILETYPAQLNNISSVTLGEGREDFVEKYLDMAIADYLSSDGAQADPLEGPEYSELNEAERRGINWLYGSVVNELLNDRAYLSVYTGKRLAELEYSGIAKDGMPQYTYIAEDGTVYQLNLNGRWVWRGDSKAVLPEGLTELLKAFPAEAGLQEENHYTFLQDDIE